MPPSLAQEKFYTLDDIYALPVGERAELIDGQIFYMAPPSTKHQRILSFLHLEIGNHIRAKGGTCEVFPAPFAVFLFADHSKYLEPDISVICDKSKLDEHGCKGAPDWIIEIVSPSSRAMVNASAMIFRFFPTSPPPFCSLLRSVCPGGRFFCWQMLKKTALTKR